MKEKKKIVGYLNFFAEMNTVDALVIAALLECRNASFEGSINSFVEFYKKKTNRTSDVSNIRKSISRLCKKSLIVLDIRQISGVNIIRSISLTDDFVERVMQEEILVTKQAFSKARKNIGNSLAQQSFVNMKKMILILVIIQNKIFLKEFQVKKKVLMLMKKKL